MHLHVAFDGAEPREVAVTDLTTVRLEDGVTGELLDLFAIDGLRAIYLVRTDGSQVVTGPDNGEAVTVEELARSVGWCSPEERQQLVDRVAELDAELAVARRANDAFEQENARAERERAAGRGLFGRRP